MPKQIVFVQPAAFSVDGTGTVIQVAEQTVTARGADYTLSIEDSSANDVFKAFLIGEGVSDTNADIVVDANADAADIDKIKAALEYAILYAQDLTGNTLTDLMAAKVKKNSTATLVGGGLFDILEAEELLTVSLDVSGAATAGSESMWDAMSDSGSAAARISIAKQIPYANYADISAGGNLDSAFKPLDSLTLYFNVTSNTFQITPVLEDVDPALYAGTPAQPTFPFVIAPSVGLEFNIKVIKKA